MRLAGLHNAANALAALALCARSACRSSLCLRPWREFQRAAASRRAIGEADGVRWYNDSKGTNVGSTVAALAGFARRHEACSHRGGEGKGQDFSPAEKRRGTLGARLVLIGRDAPLIEAAVAGAGVPIRRAASMDQAVALAAPSGAPRRCSAAFARLRELRHVRDYSIGEKCFAWRWKESSIAAKH